MTALKDVVLADLAERANVAQFVSITPQETLRFVRLRGLSTSAPFTNVQEAIAALFERASYRTVNIRTFRGGDRGGGKGHAFDYGLETIDEALKLVRRHAQEGFHTIVNETIPVDDGGVSGVALGDVIEFSPDDTPRCVEKPGTVALPLDIGSRLLETVYGFQPNVAPRGRERLEWSIHPRRVGLRRTQTLVWELEDLEDMHCVHGQPRWPNNFSRLLGDKTFGLLMAHLLGASVPHTVVVSRRIAPFAFGRASGLGERWLRTAPAEPVPGRYPTTFGWQDPYELLANADPKNEVAAVLAQDAVDAQYSGALLPSRDNEWVIEGVHGQGDAFMAGKAAPEHLPADVTKAVSETAQSLAETLGPVRMEWATDESCVWVLQLQQASATPGKAIIVDGAAAHWHVFHTRDGLDALRQLIRQVEDRDEGIILRGNVGVTSHFGDLLRRARIPSNLEVISERDD
jgi:hypothetical protein